MDVSLGIDFQTKALFGSILRLTAVWPACAVKPEEQFVAPTPVHERRLVEMTSRGEQQAGLPLSAAPAPRSKLLCVRGHMRLAAREAADPASKFNKVLAKEACQEDRCTECHAPWPEVADQVLFASCAPLEEYVAVAACMAKHGGQVHTIIPQPMESPAERKRNVRNQLRRRTSELQNLKRGIWELMSDYFTEIFMRNPAV
eukprot:2851093-Amphidinium_carterae.1